jgi:hypothetical protein
VRRDRNLEVKNEALAGSPGLFFAAPGQVGESEARRPGRAPTASNTTRFIPTVGIRELGSRGVG